LAAVISASSAQARVCTDATGRVKIDARFFAASESTVAGIRRASF